MSRKVELPESTSEHPIPAGNGRRSFFLRLAALAGVLIPLKAALAGTKNDAQDRVGALERAAIMADTIYKESFPGEKPYSRFIASSLWRTFSEPPQDWPLALCDGSTVGADEGTPNSQIIVDEIPGRESMLGDMPEAETAITAAVFRHNPKHRWWYFSNMNRDEVVLLKFHDSDETRTMRVPHTAFHDPGFPDASARESIEFRTFAYFL